MPTPPAPSVLYPSQSGTLARKSSLLVLSPDSRSGLASASTQLDAGPSSRPPPVPAATAAAATAALAAIHAPGDAIGPSVAATNAAATAAASTTGTISASSAMSQPLPSAGRRPVLSGRGSTSSEASPSLAAGASNASISSMGNGPGELPSYYAVYAERERERQSALQNERSQLNTMRSRSFFQRRSSVEIDALDGLLAGSSSPTAATAAALAAENPVSRAASSLAHTLRRGSSNIGHAIGESVSSMSLRRGSAGSGAPQRPSITEMSTFSPPVPAGGQGGSRQASPLSPASDAGSSSTVPDDEDAVQVLDEVSFGRAPVAAGSSRAQRQQEAARILLAGDGPGSRSMAGGGPPRERMVFDNDHDEVDELTASDDSSFEFYSDFDSDFDSDHEFEGTGHAAISPDKKPLPPPSIITDPAKLRLGADGSSHPFPSPGVTAGSLPPKPTVGGARGPALGTEARRPVQAPFRPPTRSGMSPMVMAAPSLADLSGRRWSSSISLAHGSQGALGTQGSARRPSLLPGMASKADQPADVPMAAKAGASPYFLPSAYPISPMSSGRRTTISGSTDTLGRVALRPGTSHSTTGTPRQRIYLSMNPPKTTYRQRLRIRRAQRINVILREPGVRKQLAALRTHKVHT
ncbi:hypothetical protein H696_00110 [Fonticula alba]|uniref:Uncharacterized protein n=1 Tax=Fonticula alba TaxID=691883 RepID=A0A058ZEZ7_FONAL|nr:hypothetical protein H696_00110 [Fonticula alba]KCV72516.1 hypothetical protein H696_00110 [Fonticula alba]|eukprot:XP_009492217.1 hypothetical protein H696_00110 [Fonticula alba]